MFRCCCEDFITKGQGYTDQENVYIYIHVTKMQTLVKNLEGHWNKMHSYVMLPSKAFQFWTVLLECIYSYTKYCTTRNECFIGVFG